MTRRQFMSPKSQAGQAIVLVVFMIIVLFGAVGLAVDGGIAYYYNASAERAAAAAALSGVVFMPGQQFPWQGIPAFSGNDATSRAHAGAVRNGFDDAAPNNNNVVISVNAVPGATNQLSVTVSRTVQTFFMGMFGMGSFIVSRTAVATYLPPLKLGQPGGTIGSTVSELGVSGFYYLRTEGYGTDRGQGDAYTPSQNATAGGLIVCGAACPSSDYHQLSRKAATDLADPSLSYWGGYNFMVTVPTGSTGQIEVYNAAFAPDNNNQALPWNTDNGLASNGMRLPTNPPSFTPLRTPNYCENLLSPPAAAKCSLNGGTCKAPSCNYWLHEDDGCCLNYGTASSYSAMEYTVFNAPSVFIRSSDSVMSQMVVRPIDASNFGASPPTYTDVNTGNIINQKFDPVTGQPRNMTAYHAWMNVSGYNPDTTCLVAVCTPSEEPESSIITYKPGRGPIGALGPGTYRLRVDTLNFDGTNSCSPITGTGCSYESYGHKGLGVRVRAGGGGPCAGCTMSALDDMAIFTPIALPGGGAFRVPIFQLTPDYAGQTISVDVFDAGDMNGGGTIFIGFWNPAQCGVACGGLLVEPNGGPPADVWNLGNSRTNVGAVMTSYAFPNPVETPVNTAGAREGDNKWFHYNIPIPSTYAPGPDPNNWWWSLNYRATAGVTAGDTITITLNLKGNPAHLVKS